MYSKTILTDRQLILQKHLFKNIEQGLSFEEIQQIYTSTEPDISERTIRRDLKLLGVSFRKKSNRYYFNDAKNISNRINNLAIQLKKCILTQPVQLGQTFSFELVEDLNPTCNLYSITIKALSNDSKDLMNLSLLFDFLLYYCDTFGNLADIDYLDVVKRNRFVSFLFDSEESVKNFYLMLVKLQQSNTK